MSLNDLFRFIIVKHLTGILKSSIVRSSQDRLDLPSLSLILTMAISKTRTSKTRTSSNEPKPTTNSDSMPTSTTLQDTGPIPDSMPTNDPDSTLMNELDYKTVTKLTNDKPTTNDSDIGSLKERWLAIKDEEDSVKKLKEYKVIYQEYQATVNSELKESILKDTNELVREGKTMTNEIRMNYDDDILDLKARNSICLEAYPEKLMFNPRDSFVKNTTGTTKEFKSSGLDRSVFDLLMDNVKLFRIVKSIQYDTTPSAYLKTLLTDIEMSEIEHFNTMGELTKELQEKLHKNLIRLAIKITNDGTVNDFGLRHLKDNDKTKIQLGLQKPTEEGKRSPVCDAKYLEKWLQYVKDISDLSKEFVPEEKEFIDTLDNIHNEMLKSRIYVKYSRWDQKLLMDYENELGGIFGEKRTVKRGRKPKMTQREYNRQMLEGMSPELRKQMEDHLTQQQLPF